MHKHHCRGCGEGFCSPCSINQMPVPARGWTYPVRVCNSCKEILSKKRDACPGKFGFAYFNSIVVIVFIEKSKIVQFYIAIQL